MKRCTKCKQFKASDMFFRDMTKKDHLSCSCKVCKSSYWQRSRTPERKEAARERTRRWKARNPRTYGFGITVKYHGEWQRLSKQRRNTLIMSDNLIRSYLVKNNNIDRNLITKEMIIEKRSQIYAKRLIEKLFCDSWPLKPKGKSIPFLHIQGLKTCTKCKKVKMLSRFNKRVSKKESKWHQSECYECRMSYESRNLTDRYINSLLSHGKSKKIKYSKDLICVKREYLKILRLLQERKNGKTTRNKDK